MTNLILITGQLPGLGKKCQYFPYVGESSGVLQEVTWIN